MPKTSPRQRKTIGRVMHEYEHGELKSGPEGKGGKVKSHRQAIAIALNEAGPPNTKARKKTARISPRRSAKKRKAKPPSKRRKAKPMSAQKDAGRVPPQWAARTRHGEPHRARRPLPPAPAMPGRDEGRALPAWQGKRHRRPDEDDQAAIRSALHNASIEAAPFRIDQMSQRNSKGEMDAGSSGEEAWGYGWGTEDEREERGERGETEGGGGGGGGRGGGGGGGGGGEGGEKRYRRYYRRYY